MASREVGNEVPRCLLIPFLPLWEYVEEMWFVYLLLLLSLYRVALFNPG